MNGDQLEGEMVYTSFDKCKWYAEKINIQRNDLVMNYSAWCKPVIRNKEEG